MATRIAELEAVLTVDDSEFSSKIDAAGKSVDDLGTKGTAAGANFGLASAAMATGAIGIGAAIAGTISAAADFEFQMDAVAAATGATGAVFADLEAQALSLGATSKFSAGEVAAVQESLGKAGLSASELLDGATDAVLNMSAATGEDLVTSAESAAAAINLFGLEGEQITGVADTFTAGLNNSSASLSDFQTGMNNLGPVMSNLARYAEDPEKAFTDTAAAVAYFNSQGLKAADAGISLARGMTNLADPTSDASALMTELGISAFDAQGNFLALPDIMDQLQIGMAGMSDQAREAALATIFGAEAADVMNIAIKNGGDGLREYEGLMVSSGQAAEQAAIRQSNFTGAMEALNGSIEGAKIAFGVAFLPILTEVVTKLTDLVNVFTTLPQPIQTVVAVVAAGAAGFLAIGSAIGFIIGPLGAFLGLLAPVAAGVLAIAGPLALVAAGLVALKIAYDQNFLGFADGVNAAVAGLMTGFNNLILLVQNVATAFGEGGLGAALAVLGDAFGLAFSNLSIAAQTGLQAVSDAIIAWVASAPAMLDGAWSAIQAGASAAWDAITAATSAAWGVIQEAVAAGIAALQAAVTAGWEAITAGVGPAWEAVTSAVSAAWTTIQTTVSTALEAVKQIVSDAWIAVESSIAGALETAKATVLAAWSAIRETVALEMQTITETVSNTWTGIETTISGILATIQSTISAAWDAITTTVTTALQAIQEATGVQFETIGTVISGAMEAIQSTISGAWEAIQSATTTVLQAITSAVTAQFDAIKTTITTAATEAKDGFISTLESMASEAITAVTGIKDGIVGIFADARSWLAQAGADIIGGLIDGILSMAGQVADAVASVVPSEISVGTPTLDFLGGGGGGGSVPESGRGSYGNRAAGGPVRAGFSYWVGEEGPEPFIPSRSGTIIPNDVAMSMMGGGGGGNQIIENLTVILPDVTTPQEFAAAMQDFARSNGVAAGRGVG